MRAYVSLVSLARDCVRLYDIHTAVYTEHAPCGINYVVNYQQLLHRRWDGATAIFLWESEMPVVGLIGWLGAVGRWKKLKKLDHSCFFISGPISPSIQSRPKDRRSLDQNPTFSWMIYEVRVAHLDRANVMWYSAIWAAWQLASHKNCLYSLYTTKELPTYLPLSSRPSGPGFWELFRQVRRH